MGQIFTFSGPRGVGKTTIMDDLRDIIQAIHTGKESRRASLCHSRYDWRGCRDT